ncbi:HGGxSTG domain-containing protein [uncultured Erythrobacter sp.]
MQREPEPEALRRAPRCQARTRQGKSCGSPAVRGKTVCRMHGAFAGAPKGRRNGSFKHGGHTKEARALRDDARRLLRILSDAA